MCRSYENFPFFFQHRNVVRGIAFNVPCLDKPPSRRRIPNVIRRRHKASCTGDIDCIKSCAGIFENHAQHGGRRSRSGFQRCSSITCGQFPHLPGYHPDERHGPAAKAARIRRLKPCAGLNETADSNGSATGYCTGNRVQPTVCIRYPEPGTLPASGYRHTVFIETI